VEIKFRQQIPVGFTVYDYKFESLTYLACKWYLYPFYRTISKLKRYRACIYRWLNRINIMHTPEGCIMELSDIWRARQESLKGDYADNENTVDKLSRALYMVIKDNPDIFKEGETNER
jgi:hypothetical protein